MKQPSKQELRQEVARLTAELEISRASEMQTKERLQVVSEDLIMWRNRAVEAERSISEMRRLNNVEQL
jgi:hypothetical protein